MCGEEEDEEEKEEEGEDGQRKEQKLTKGEGSESVRCAIVYS